MIYRISNNPQNTDDWLNDRLGKITGSVASKIITRTGKRSSSLEEVVNRAVAELVTQYPDETFQSESMLRGKELEDQALKYYNFVYGYEFKKVGFMEAINPETGESEGFGVSPDGLEPVIGLELKVPEAHTHLAYLAANELPDKYFQQVQAAMMVSGFDEWVFGSYHPSFPCVHIRVQRDEKFIKAMRSLFIEARDMVREKYLTVSRMVEAS